MKKILLYIAGLVLLVFAADRILYHFLKKEVFDKVLSGGAGGYIHYLTQHKRHVDFLVMGDSRARLHVNPALLTNLYNGNGFNAGISSVGGVFYNHVLLDMLLRQGIKPKAIILQTDAYVYYVHDIERELSVMFNFIEESPVLADYVRSFNFRDRMLLQSRMFRFNGKLLNMLYNYRKIDKVGDESGYAPEFRTVDTLYDQTDTAIHKVQHTFLKSRSEALRGIYTLCHDHGIQLYILTMPTFRNRVLNPYDEQDLAALIATMPGARYLRMNNIDDYPTLAGAENWNDAYHFNDKGATRFSRILNDSLKAAGIR